MSFRLDGGIQIEECASHTQVVWEFAFPQSNAFSPIFQFGDQSFQLSFEDHGDICHVLLKRKGPECRYPDRAIRWWAGLKRPDGTYYYRIKDGKLHFKKKHKSFQWVTTLRRIRASELEAQHLLANGRLSFFLRLQTEQVSYSEETCVHDIVVTPEWNHGRVLVKEYPNHKEFQWKLRSESLGENYFRIVSAEFVFSRQRYLLELKEVFCRLLKLNLYRLGPPEEGESVCVEWWVGLKRGDGFYHHRYASGQLDLKLDCPFPTKVKTLKQFSRNEIVGLQRGQDGNLTIVFLLLNGNRTLAEAGISTQGVAIMTGQGDGIIVEEGCSCQKKVQWNVQCEPALKGYRNLASSAFKVGNQHYLLELCLVQDYLKVCLSLNLMRMGPSVEGSFRWRAWLERRGGTCCKYIESKKLELRRNCTVWEEVGSLMAFTRTELDAEHLIVDGCVAFFLHISEEEVSCSDNVCNRGSPEMFGGGDVSIREVESPSYKRVEWDVCYEPTWDCWRLHSPIFVLLNYSFMFELCYEKGFLVIEILGRPRPNSIAGSVTLWAGLKCRGGTYNHKTVKLKFSLPRKHYLWNGYQLPNRISQSELEREHLSSNGTLTFFLSVNLTDTEEVHSFYIDKAPSRGEGVVRIEELSSFTHVEWKFDHPQEYRRVTSNEFKAGNQCFLLELSIEPNCVNLFLYKKEPGIPDQRRVRCWAGLKGSDGCYYHRNFRGRLKFQVEFKTWMRSRVLCRYTAFEFNRNLLSPSRELTVFFRFALCGLPNTFMFDLPGLSCHGNGSIREEEGNFSKEVEWIVDFPDGPDTSLILASPEFTFGDQRFLLQLSLKYPKCVLLTLFRFGPPASGRVRWWAGRKRIDRSYYHRTQDGELGTEEVCEIWRMHQRLAKFDLSVLERHHLLVDGKLTYFLRLMEATEEASFCSSVELSAMGIGTIRQENCMNHAEVEWCVEDLPREDSWSLPSPEFEIAKQRYMLELSRLHDDSSECFRFHVHRMGPAVDESVRFWVGLKKSDGAYYHRNERGTLNLKESYELWREVKELYNIFGTELNRELFSPLHRITFFFRLSLARPSTGSEICIHGSADASTKGDGIVRVEECASHKYIQWDLDCTPNEIDWSLTSSSFGFGNQLYLLELLPLRSHMRLNLYRMGPCVDCPSGSVRWCVGLGILDAEHGYRNRSGKLELTDECEVWRHVKQLRDVYVPERATGGRLTFMFWLSSPGSSSSLDECVHMSRVKSVPRYGSIAEEEWETFKQVEWHTGFEPAFARNRILASPDISIGNQTFILDASYIGDFLVIGLFRRGTAAGTPARYYLGASLYNGVYQQHWSKTSEVDLKDSCDVWTEVDDIYLKIDFCRRFYSLKNITVALLFSLERGSMTTEVANSGVEAIQKFQPSDKDTVVFKVQGKEFKEHRAVINIRVPALAAVFHHDTVEKRTGMVHIDDCDPGIFEVFLKYVVTKELSDLPMDEFFAVYALADKYLMEPLTSECLRRIECEMLSEQTLSDILQLMIRYETQDLLNIASRYLKQNESNTKSEVWQNFCREYPETAHNIKTGPKSHFNCC